jgi:glycosyltransferase involved in cell wall biosynthesis
MIVDNNYPDIRVEREAKALLAHGFEVDVICVRAPGEPRFERSRSLRIYRLPVRRRRGASAAVQMWEYVSFMFFAAAMVARRHARASYSSVQVHNVPDFLVFSAVVPKVLGAPVILDLHDLMPEFFISRFAGRVPGFVLRLVQIQEHLSAAFADRVITVTELWRQTLISRGLAPDKVAVVMNLPDERMFQLRERTAREASSVLIVYHGTITHRYGLDVLMRAFALASKQEPLRLLVHGRGEYLDELRTLADDLAITDRVEFSTRLLATEDLADLIRQADIGVVPNRKDTFTDGILPTKLLEYAALGVPAIVSRSSAVETYFTSDMVRFVTPGDVGELAGAIIELANNRELRESLATGAQQFSQEHRWVDEARAYVGLVTALTEQKNRRKPEGMKT